MKAIFLSITNRTAENIIIPHKSVVMRYLFLVTQKSCQLVPKNLPARLLHLIIFNF